MKINESCDNIKKEKDNIMTQAQSNKMVKYVTKIKIKTII